MKRILIALFAVALLSGVPLYAQYEEDPATTELQTEEMETETATGAEIETETELDGEVETEVDTDDFDASLDSDLDDDELGDDELPATGSELPLAALLGLGAIAGAAALRIRS